MTKKHLGSVFENVDPQMSSSSINVFHDHHGCRVVAVATWVDHRPGSARSRDISVTKMVLPVKDKNQLSVGLEPGPWAKTFTT